MKKVNLLSKAEMKKVMGGVVDGNCGSGYVGYTCEISFNGVPNGPAISCIPVSSGQSGSNESAAGYMLDRYLTLTEMCVGDVTCSTVCTHQA